MSVSLYGMWGGPPLRRRGGRGLPDPYEHWNRNTPASAGRTDYRAGSPSLSTEHPRVGGEDWTCGASRNMNVGTPPRRRGGLRLKRGVQRPRRNTPATAGRTRSPTARRSVLSEHPRDGGEDRLVDAVSARPVGTPPRWRGGPACPWPLRGCRRNTPASAGRTVQAGTGRRPMTEHPRDGGEDQLSHGSRCIGFGTPPRRRGGPCVTAPYPCVTRNTLASAGRTPPDSSPAPSPPEYPRDGGEDVSDSTSVPHPDGTPPRRRGGQALLVGLRRHARNTSASAGRTCAPSGRYGRPSEHPRVGGEDRVTCFPCAARTGTPPRRRGGRGGRVPRLRPDRYTPASARRTGDGPQPAPSHAEHPRVGGEHPAVADEGGPIDGTPPASAGSTRSQCRWWAGPAEHPRDGGEDTMVRSRSSFSCGTPPRRRGGPPARLPHRGPRRNTPATAGRTRPGPVLWGPSPEHPRDGGRTTNWRGSRCEMPEHPRDGGEDAEVAGVLVRLAGTPPRRQGGRTPCPGSSAASRNTPASAGRTCDWSRYECRLSEHPRVGGEDRTSAPNTGLVGGTPPRRRGGRPPAA